jgi:hypothetical protein
MALLEYDFRVVGQNNINRAFASIEQRAAQHASKMDRMFGGTGSRRGAAGVAGARAATRSTVTAETQAARTVANAKIREEKRVLSEQLKNARYLQQVRNRHFQNEERAAKRLEASNARGRARTLGMVGASVGGTLKTAGRYAAGALAIGGGFALTGAVSQQMRETAMASDLANQMGDPTQKGRILKEAQGVRGFTGEQTLSAMSGFVEKTGDVNAARAAIQDLSQLALATGTDFGDMGEAAGQAFNVIRDSIKDPKKQIEALNEVMSAFAAQGNMGAVEIKDLAVEIASLGAASRKYLGDPAQMLKNMGAMAQAAVARGGAANAAEASTAVVRFGEDLTKKPAQKALAGMGINIFGDKAKTILKDPKEILADVMKATGGDMTKLQDVFNAQSIKAFQGFSPLMKEAEDANAKLPKGQRLAKGEAGKRALLGEFGKFADAKLSKETIAERAGSRLEDADKQFTDAMKKFNAEVGSRLLPALTKLIPKIAELTPYVTAFIDKLIWAIEKFGVLGTIGGAIAAKVTADIAAASIGEAITKAIVGGGGGGGGLASMVSTMVTALGPMGVAALAATAALTAAAGMAWSVYNTHKKYGDEADKRRKDREAGLDPYQGTAGADPNLQGSPAAIQKQLMGDNMGTFDQETGAYRAPWRGPVTNSEGVPVSIAAPPDDGASSSLKEAADKQSKAAQALIDAAGKAFGGSQNTSNFPTVPTIR